MTDRTRPVSDRRPRGAGAALVGLRLAVGALFAGSALLKLQAPHDFTRAVQAYELLGEQGSFVVAALLPWLELLIGLCLLLGVLVPGGLALATALLATFAAAQVSALARGLTIGCGCFGVSAEDLVGGLTVARTVGLMVVAALGFLACLRVRAAAGDEA